MGFMGYKRPDGSCGVRNYVAVMSSVSCASGVVNAIWREVPEVKAINHTEGCGRGLEDVDIATRTLIGLGKNPNVAGILIVGLGCEVIKSSRLADAICSTNKPTVSLVIQERGGTRKSTAEGIEIARRLLDQAKAIEREMCEWESLIVGLECGGSDALSGVTANPLVGKAADWLVDQGATVILTETTEMIGTDHILARRASNPGVAEQIVDLIKRQQQRTVDFLGEQAHMIISPGNIEGGLSNIIEKSLGCIVKGGTSPINEVIEYGAAPGQKGLVIMDTPGSDIFSLTGMAAGGAQLMIFTMGRGTPAGFPIVPVIKVATNTEMYEALRDDMDINAGKLLQGVSMDEAGNELNDLLRKVVEGQETKAEMNNQDFLSIYTLGPPF